MGRGIKGGAFEVVTLNVYVFSRKAAGVSPPANCVYCWFLIWACYKMESGGGQLCVARSASFFSHLTIKPVAKVFLFLRKRRDDAKFASLSSSVKKSARVKRGTLLNFKESSSSSATKPTCELCRRN